MRKFIVSLREPLLGYEVRRVKVHASTEGRAVDKALVHYPGWRVGVVLATRTPAVEGAA